MEKAACEQKDITPQFYRIAYGAFVALSIYFLIKGDLSSFCMQFGIALVFDPFNQEVTWKARPLYQRVWMILHLVILFGAFTALILS
ncbi:MAG: hypothetical protein WED33_13555 [Bacteroidia bacterium]